MIHQNEPKLNELYKIRTSLYKSNEKDVIKKVEAIESQIKRHQKEKYGVGQSN